MIVLEREVRFEDVDPAQIVFFARFLSYAHEAMERFFGERCVDVLDCEV